ncbi:NmrA-like family domain-containing protein 1 [Colletotrichum tropicale]|nr:NmrA-like family domain-containing protein 1 [Colletotrichum tropicale]
MPILCVLGATGTQGGSVCQVLLNNPNWQGIEVVSADASDEASLERAFQGAHALYAFTNYDWNEAFRSGRNAAGDIERQQALNIARAAAKITTLEHYIMSSLPPAGKVSGEKLNVPHMDYKGAAFDWIKDNLPELAMKTTRLWLGWYASNLAYFPMMKFIPVPGSQGFVFAQPSRADALLPAAGDVNYNTGVMVESILQAGANSHGKVAILVTEYISFMDMIRLWEKVTGKDAVYVELSDEAVAKLWGVAGEEIAAQFRWSELFPNWERVAGSEIITLDTLGVKEKLVGVEALLGKLRDSLV